VVGDGENGVDTMVGSWVVVRNSVVMIEDENDRDGCFALTIETIEKNGTVAGSSSGANSSAAGSLGGAAGSVVAAGPVVAAGAVAVSTEFDCTERLA
jgi:hypothetical protein